MNQQPNQQPQAAKREVTKDQLIEEFNAVVADTEQLLKSVATAGGEKGGHLREGVEQKLAVAKDRLRVLQQTAVKAAVDKTGAAAHATDEYAHAHPWQSIGAAAGLAAIAGVALGILLSRR
jgi:ElaB/YqjD/DUF883 family membrane-anchored ribosome-binding protein